MNILKTLIPLVVTSVVLAGCSFEDLFAKLATSNVEEGAREEYQQANAAAQQMEKIHEKQQQYSESAELKNVSDMTKFVAYAFRKHDGTTSQIDFEGLLSNPGKQVYQLWLLSDDNRNKIQLGSLQYNQGDNYSLSYNTNKNLSNFNTVLLSKETTVDDTLETVVMTGTFVANASPSASPVIKK